MIYIWIVYYYLYDMQLNHPSKTKIDVPQKKIKKIQQIYSVSERAWKS